MERLQATIEKATGWAQAQRLSALALPPETLLQIIACLAVVAALLFILVVHGWIGRSRFHQRLRIQESALDDLRKRYESEVSWRMTGYATKPEAKAGGPLRAPGASEVDKSPTEPPA